MRRGPRNFSSPSPPPRAVHSVGPTAETPASHATWTTWAGPTPTRPSRSNTPNSSYCSKPPRRAPATKTTSATSSDSSRTASDHGYTTPSSSPTPTARGSTDSDRPHRRSTASTPRRTQVVRLRDSASQSRGPRSARSSVAGHLARRPAVPSQTSSSPVPWSRFVNYRP